MPNILDTGICSKLTNHFSMMTLYDIYGASGNCYNSVLFNCRHNYLYCIYCIDCLWRLDYEYGLISDLLILLLLFSEDNKSGYTFCVAESCHPDRLTNACFGLVPFTSSYYCMAITCGFVYIHRWHYLWRYLCLLLFPMRNSITNLTCWVNEQF